MPSSKARRAPKTPRRRVLAAADANALVGSNEQETLRLAEQPTAKLQAVMAAVSAALTARKVARVVVEQGQSAIATRVIAVVRTNARGIDEVLAASHGGHKLQRSPPTIPRSLQPLLGECLRQRRAIFSPPLPAADGVGDRAAAALPLLVHGRPIGAIVLLLRRGAPLLAQDKSFLLALAHQCAQALERTRLYEAERAARAEAQASEQRYRILAEAIPQMVWAARPDGQLEYFNQRWFTYTGMSQEQALLFGWESAVHPDCKKRCTLAWRTSLAHGRDLEIECRLRRARDGAYRWHLMRARPVKGAGGRLQKWVGTCTDIDDQKRSEAASRLLSAAGAALSGSLDYEAPLRAVAELLAEALVDWCAIDVLEGNGLKRLAIASALSRRLGEPEGPARIFLCDAVTQALQTQETQTLRADGNSATQTLLNSLGFVALVLIPMQAGGRAVGCIAIGSCGGERPLGATEIALVEEVARRMTLAVDNARLYREAQKANRLKDEFLATVSHELRTPLNAMLGWTQLLRRDVIDADTLARGLETIERNGVLQAKIIADILDISRIVTGKLKLDVRPTELSSVISEAVESLRPAADAKRITVELEIEMTASHIRGDADRLQQVIWNLLSNAIKFTPQRGCVRISLARFGGVARVTVKDNGPGIAQEFLPYVFDRFSQAEAAPTRQHGGLGLGLAIVRHIVELHGGTVRVESGEQCGGTAFYVDLPVAAVRLDNDDDDVSNDSPEHTLTATDSVPRLDGLHVLVVDDDRDARELLCAVLKRSGADVTVASGAAEALANVSSVDVMLSDIAMPGEDGYALLRKVRALPPHVGGSVPAVALTAFARQPDRDKALAAGFNRHIAKPVDPHELVAMVAELAGATLAGNADARDRGRSLP